MKTYHKEPLLDRAAMLAMRTLLAVHPKLQFGSESRPEFDSLMEGTPAAEGMTYEVTISEGLLGGGVRRRSPWLGVPASTFMGARTFLDRLQPTAISLVKLRQEPGLRPSLPTTGSLPSTHFLQP